MKIPLYLYLSLTLIAGSLGEVLKTRISILSRKDVFLLYTRNNSIPDEIRATHLEDMDKSHFQREKPSFIIIANVLPDLNIPINKNIRTALLQIKDANVVTLAYQSIFLLGTNPVRKFGQIVAKFVNYATTNYGVSVSSFNFIGYDFGAYVAAHAGNLLEGKITTIVGLDPNKVMFPKYPLNFNSSTKVTILHTSSYGSQTNVGNIDIYFNNAREQPNCGLFQAVNCAHFKAYEYYRETILDPGIIATTCDSYENFVRGACNNNQKVSVGSLLLDGMPYGTYYLNYTAR